MVRALENPVLRPILLGVSTAAVTLVPVRRWPAPLRALYHWGPAAATGAGAALVLSGDDRDRPLEPALAAAAGVAVGAATYAGSVAAERLDSSIESVLTRLHLPLPRLWMSAAAAALAVSLDVSDERSRSEDAASR